MFSINKSCVFGYVYIWYFDKVGCIVGIFESSFFECYLVNVLL